MTAGDQFRAGKRLWSENDDAILRARYPHEPTKPLAVALRRSPSATYARAARLGLEKSEAYLASPEACRLRSGQGAATRFQPGQTPMNKGLRRPGWHRGRMRETQFQPGGPRTGQAVRVYKPIGTERMSKDGYLERKVNDNFPLQARWRAVHLVIWESVHGRIPQGHALVFVNGDKRDIRLENLALVTRAELMARNTVHNLPAPLPQIIQLLGAMTRRIRRQERHDAAQQD